MILRIIFYPPQTLNNMCSYALPGFYFSCFLPPHIFPWALALKSYRTFPLYAEISIGSIFPYSFTDQTGIRTSLPLLRELSETFMCLMKSFMTSRLPPPPYQLWSPSTLCFECLPVSSTGFLRVGSVSFLFELYKRVWNL